MKSTIFRESNKEWVDYYKVRFADHTKTIVKIYCEDYDGMSISEKKKTIRTKLGKEYGKAVVSLSIIKDEKHKPIYYF